MKAQTKEILWPKQAEIIRAVAREPRVAVASCNAAGKSYLAARTVIWFLRTFRPCVVITTAPTDRQVRRIIWREIHSAYHRAKAAGILLGPEPKTKEWALSRDQLAFGFSTRNYDATAFQGIHAPHVLVVVDEAAGISEAIWEGILSVLRGAHTRLLSIGNPTQIDGQFFGAFGSDRWWTTNISAMDTPNLQGQGIVVPGLITAQDVEDAKADWGEDSPLYVSRILGRFPDAVDDTLILLSVATAAGQGWDLTDPEVIAEMDTIDRNEPVEIGADLARYGADLSVYVARRGRLAFDVDAFGAGALGRTGLMTATGRLVQFIERNISKGNGRCIVKCDAVGLGGGVPDRLRELQIEGKLLREPVLTIIDCNAGARALNPAKYVDAGTEWWVGLNKRMKNEAALGPVFALKPVVDQLTRRKYRLMSDGRTRLESKDEMKKRGLRSPDYGDAVAMAYAETAPSRLILDDVMVI